MNVKTATGTKDKAEGRRELKSVEAWTDGSCDTATGHGGSALAAKRCHDRHGSRLLVAKGVQHRSTGIRLASKQTERVILPGGNLRREFTVHILDEPYQSFIIGKRLSR